MRIFYGHSLSENLVSFANLARCVGIDAELFDVQDAAGLVTLMSDCDGGFVLEVASLAPLVTPDGLIQIGAFLRHRNVSVLLLLTEETDAVSRVTEILTDGAVTRVHSSAPATSIYFSEGAGSVAAELVSQSFPRGETEVLGLTLNSGREVAAIMRLDDSPSFVQTTTGLAKIFVWSSTKVFDVLRPLTREQEFEDAVDEYVPAIIFLRTTFGDQCWHNPLPAAGLVIDDPLLNRQYGFIDFPSLLRSARKCRYHVTLAFIPWNHWRSRKKSVQEFIDHADCFSICAHGCDHTRNEFSALDYQDLLARNFAARRRMDQHEERTGIPCEPLMVCPQEQYSLEGLRAFANSRQFLALVNTACMPREGSANRLRGADLLLAAQDSYFGFPIFKRHYHAGDLAVFAMALFLGKPAILVEHHEFFRDGPGGVEDFVSRLRQFNPRLRWKSLYETVIQTHLRRRDEGNHWQIRFFTDQFQFAHEMGHPSEYHLTRRIPAATEVQSVRVNHQDVPFTRNGDQLDFQLCVNEPQIVEVEIVVHPTQPAKTYAAGPKYSLHVAARRALSELRDNLLARNRFVFNVTQSLARALKQTGGS